MFIKFKKDNNNISSYPVSDSLENINVAKELIDIANERNQSNESHYYYRLLVELAFKLKFDTALQQEQFIRDADSFILTSKNNDVDINAFISKSIPDDIYLDDSSIPSFESCIVETNDEVSKRHDNNLFFYTPLSL